MKNVISSTAILEMESRYRADLINSLTGFKSASLIGTTDKNGNTNLAVFSSVVHLGSNPALIAFVNRPDPDNKDTLKNILETNYYTINHINKDIYRLAHQTSARYPREISEFDAVGLTVEFGTTHPAPYVKECHVKYGLEFVELHELKINGTILVIGKVVEIIIPQNCLLDAGSVDIEKAETVTISGLDTYHTTQKLAKLTYAKEGILPQNIE